MTQQGSYKDLIVWQKAVDLVVHIYEATKEFPAEEKYGLVAQMRRAAVSIPSNIAEGHERHSTGEFVLGLSHAQGSAAELETQLIISGLLCMCPDGLVMEISSLLGEVRKMLNALRRKLEAR
jgi:four helix bundle protein